MTSQRPRHDRSALLDRIRGISHHLEPIPTGAEERTPPLGDIRAVLFDAYGTLLISGSGDVGVREAADNGADLSAALRSTGIRGDYDRAAARGLEALAERIRAFHEVMRGRDVRYPEVDIRMIWREVLRILRGEGLVHGEYDAAAIERLAVEYECRVNPVWPMPGMMEILESLRDREILLGLVSNAQFFTPLLFKALLDESVTALGFREDLCFWSFSLLEAKPSRTMYQRALKRLLVHDEIEPDQVLYVGNDIRNDIWPAAALGCRTALFAGDQRSLRLREDDRDCASVRPDAVVCELGSILQLIG